MATIPGLAYFQARIGHRFLLKTAADEKLTMTLEDVTEPAARPVGFECFSLLLGGPQDTFLPQAIYELEVDATSMELFLVPAGKDEKGFFYDVTINRKLNS